MPHNNKSPTHPLVARNCVKCSVLPPKNRAHLLVSRSTSAPHAKCICMCVGANTMGWMVQKFELSHLATQSYAVNQFGWNAVGITATLYALWPIYIYTIYYTFIFMLRRIGSAHGNPQNRFNTELHNLIRAHSKRNVNAAAVQCLWVDVVYICWQVTVKANNAHPVSAA